MSEREAKRAWERWAKEKGFDAEGLTWTHEAFLAGFEAGAEAYLKFLKDAKQEEP